jgi:GTP-binding protein EngB required for normal cell division
MSELREVLMRATSELGEIHSPAVQAAVASVSAFLAESAYMGDERLRVGLVGAFNAGKSSFVNAVAKRRVAAVDALEMTGWVAVYGAAESDGVVLIREKAEPERLSLDQFVKQTEAREWTNDRRRSIVAVDIGLVGFPQGFTLVDLPGLGASRENEARMRDALKLVDLVLWMCDLESVGEIRSAELVRELRRTGVPTLLVVTKVDLLDEPAEEFPEIAAHVAGRAEVAEREVIGLTTIPIHERDPAGPFYPYRTEALLERIRASVPHTLGLRTQAADGLLQSAANTLGLALDAEIGDRRWQQQAFADDVERFRAVATHVSNELQDLVNEVVSDALFANRADTVSRLAAGFDEHGGAVSPTAILGVDPLASENMRRVLSVVLQRLEAQELRAWSRYAEKGELGARFSDQTSDLLSRVIHGHTPGSMMVGGGRSNGEQEMKVGMATALLTAAGATVWAAAAPTITAGMALSGIGLPILGIGALATWGVKSWMAAQKAPTRPAAEAWVNETIRSATQMLLGAGLGSAIESKSQERATQIAAAGHPDAASPDAHQLLATLERLRGQLSTRPALN